MIESFLPFQLFFSHQVMSNSLWHHGLHHTRRPCPSYLPEFPQTQVPWVGDAIQPFHPLSPSSPPALNCSPNQGLFYESTLHIRWPEYWKFIFSISPSSEYSSLIFFMIDRFDLFAVQETLKSFLQHHNSKASILQSSAFFMVQLSHSYMTYMTVGKTIAFTIRTFDGKVMSLLLNMLSGFVIALLPRNKHLLISWLQSLSRGTLEPKRIKSAPFLLFPHLFAMNDGTGCHDLSFFNAEF